MIELLKLNELNQNQFRNLIHNRQVKILYGFGIDVDKQKSDQANYAMKKVLQGMFPDYTIIILKSGRYGAVKNDTYVGWEFDDTMTSLGHPEFWIPGSRGYYALTKNSVFLFPKSDMDFKDTYKKIFCSKLGVRVEEINKGISANSWAESECKDKGFL